MSISPALPLLGLARRHKGRSFTVAIVIALVQAQQALDRDWGEVWRAANRVLKNRSLRQDTRPRAREIILDYLTLYQGYDRKEVKSMEIPQNPCQSCGMPLQKPEDHGTEVNGNRSADYCHFCYQSGKFTDPNQTMEQMIDLVTKYMVSEMKMPEPAARQTTSSFIPTLRRWQK